ncbi:hypothetical protein TcasGA2_TC002580 [Tribolium castaneum]|uniref:Ionotropic glutamate receptor C-terminal domain-containing protein n=1 Tax=Tribolium castaneum TaxID=7070 RepID=D6WFK9_TRICA|nr:hypothetical protein TcasGA2_TC002580 [Tribolium castaneum]
MYFENTASLLLLFTTVYATRHQLDLNLDTGGQNECVYKIMKQYYATPWTILLLDTDMHFPYPCIYLKTSQENFTKNIHRPADFYIITLENRSLENILDLLEKFEIFDSKGYFLIILTEPYDPYIFEMLVYYFICKVVVLTLEDDLITYDPFIYEDVLANGIEPTDLGKCANFNFSSVNFFNKTLPFLWRNTTVMATFVEHFPYLHQDYMFEYNWDNLWNETLNESFKASGLFYSIFEIVAEKIQFGTNLKAVEFINNSANEMLNLLQLKNSHVMLNYRQFDVHSLTKFDLVGIHLAFDHHWVTPQCAQKNVWKIFFGKFDVYSLTLTLLCLILLSVYLCYLSDDKDFTSSVIVNYQMLFESAISTFWSFRKNSIRVLVAFTLCSFLIISTLIKSELIDSFTTGVTECPIKNLQDIIKNNLTCYVSNEIKEFYNQLNNSYSRYVKNCVQFDEDSDLFAQLDVAEKTALYKNAAFVTVSLKYKFIVFFMVASSSSLYFIKPQIKFDYLYAYFTKGYPLCDSFSKVFQRMDSAGLIQFYYNQEVNAIDRWTLTVKQLVSEDIKTFERVIIVFNVWLVGITISIATFLIEIVRGKMK